jgi:hypothetical protein
MSVTENHTLGVQGAAMAGMMAYAQPFRAIGQALEVLKIEGFEMELSGSDFFVRGNVPLAHCRLLMDQCNAEQLRTIWGSLPPQGDALGKRRWLSDPSTLSRIELCYTAEDVKRLDEEGRSRRGKSESVGDALSLSQILRSVGAYLNQKRARLSKIIRESDSLAVEYETSVGSKMKETLASKDLYDLWVRMYLQRAERTSH